MKVALVPNATEQSQAIVQQLKALLTPAGIVVDQNAPDVVISIGGDGTLLSAFHQFQHLVADVRFIGIHTGHLGFYTDWLADELVEFVASLKRDNGQRVSYPLLEMTVTRANGEQVRYLALNEAAIKQPEGTLVADIYLGEVVEHVFERFRGDGLAIATPTGSTAYNKANGGAVLHPSVEAIQMSEIASINNRVYRTLGSPLVASKNQQIRIVPQTQTFMLSIDQLVFEVKDVASLTFRVAPQRIHFAEYRHLDFWQRVQQSFIGDIE
jgi:NAD+ kinase